MRDIVGYGRYDTQEQVAWLNTVYARLDVYANACLPLRKVVSKKREGSHVHKKYDVARTPLQRAFDAGVVCADEQERWERWAESLNPLQLHRQLTTLLAQGPEGVNLATPPTPGPMPVLTDAVATPGSP
ncbi:Integrase core domain-containing protein (fragment) [Kyrpidia spormannii]|uniref:Integrase core domain-containing protein n=2 Tax=Kyrpidia spormannii TaxID=2055160 RepID=A0ACA8Z6U5_9BACL